MKKTAVCVYRGIHVGPAAFPGDGWLRRWPPWPVCCGEWSWDGSGESSLQQVSQVIDTVIRREGVRDTVYSVRPESKVASWQVGEKGKRSRRNCTRSPDTGGKPETGTGDETLQARTGKCVLEDGIDYSMLWEAVKAGK